MTISGIEFSPALARAGFSITNSAAKAIGCARNMIYKYRTKGPPVIPEEIPSNTFKENPITQQLEKGSSEQLHHLRTGQINEQPIIRTQTRNVRTTIEKKIVINPTKTKCFSRVKTSNPRKKLFYER